MKPYALLLDTNYKECLKWEFLILNNLISVFITLTFFAGCWGMGSER